MRSLHFTRWVSQLKDSGHELYWFDILNGGYIKELDWVQQFTQWKYKGGNFKGRYYLKRRLPKIHKLLENNLEKEFEKILIKIKPDIVHSFVMYKCTVPVFNVMRRFRQIKWIYSSWGSDLFYFKELPKHRKDILNVLKYIDYLFTDNKRDSKIAQNLGFSGEFLGVFPGGGGFHINEVKQHIIPVSERNIILIKGYQGRSGRAIEVLKALKFILNNLKPYKVVVFGTDSDVASFINTDSSLKSIAIKIYTKKKPLSHSEVLKLMGQTLIYIGNSNSDGMPNTLLEAIVMGAFPIQSNPGGVTEEIITHETNGMLIHNHEDVYEIANTIKKSLNNYNMLNKAFKINVNLQQELDFLVIKSKVLNAYNHVQKEIKQ
jgi:hypothetical protein